MLPLRYQILGHLIVGLAAGYLLSLALAPGASEIERKAEPFTTQHGMLAVTMILRRDGPPEIVRVTPLAEGRVSVAQPGPYSLTLLDRRGRSLYSLSFRALFLLPGEPPASTDEIRQIFVIPAGAEAEHIMLTGPHGSAGYDLP